MAALFGFEFRRKVPEEAAVSIAPKEHDDGAVQVAAGGFGTYVDLDGTVKTEAELVTKYREMALTPECDAAVDEIVNEFMDIDEENIVSVNLDKLDISESLKSKIIEEFENCLNILDFQRHAYDICRKWYVDGRLYYHVVIDEKNPQDGIKEVRYIDPRKIRKVRQVVMNRVKGAEQGDAVITKTQNEYFIFNDKGFAGTKLGPMAGPSATTTSIKIAKDSILHISSGLTDSTGALVLSYLHKSIKALNQLRTLEDALVIYRLARAPERRVWYIDVGGLPRMKAEQYLRDIMVKHKNRLIYDADSGQVKDDRKYMTMLEDYWLPRREGGKGTEVTTLAGGQNLGQMEDVLYFEKKFYKTLNVPVNRISSDDAFSVGRATEITRDEVKFARFVTRLRSKFSMLFTEMLEKQLVLKKIFSIEDWENICADIKYDFAKDNYFSELKDAEVRAGRIEQGTQLQPFVGKYYSNEWVRKNVFKQTDEDIKDEDKQIKKETMSGDPRWINAELQQTEMNVDAMNQQMNTPPTPEGMENGGPAQPPKPVGATSTRKTDEAADKDEEQEKAKTKKIANATSTYKLMTKKKDKSNLDKTSTRSAAQIISKNK